MVLGGWLGGALAWHFTFAWLFAAAVLLYFLDLARGGWRRVWLSPCDWRGIWPMARYYFLRGPKPALTDLYNPLQKAAYLWMTGTLALALATGALLAQPALLGSFVHALGGWQNVRLLHFACLCAFAGFVPGHLVMVALAGKSAIQAMLTGRTAPDAAFAPLSMGASPARMPALHALPKPTLEVVDAERKPGRPIHNRPQVGNLPHIGPQSF